MRDLKKARGQYEKMREAWPPKKGAFYMSDYYQIRDMSMDIFELMDNALVIGFVIGYKCAKREAAHPAPTR